MRVLCGLRMTLAHGLHHSCLHPATTTLNTRSAAAACPPHLPHTTLALPRHHPARSSTLWHTQAVAGAAPSTPTQTQNADHTDALQSLVMTAAAVPFVAQHFLPIIPSRLLQQPQIPQQQHSFSPHRDLSKPPRQQKKTQPRLPQNLHPLCTQVLAHIKTHKLLTPGERVLVAVSGSAESVCMARALKDISAYGSWNLVLAHVMLPDSDAQQSTAQLVRDLAKEWELPYVESDNTSHALLAHRSNCVSRESSKRFLQDAVFSLQNLPSPCSDSLVADLFRLADQQRCSSIATARSASSRAVSLLGSLLTGEDPAHASSSSSGALFPEPQRKHAAHFIHPLLNVSNVQATDFCTTMGLPFCDPSHTTPRTQPQHAQHAQSDLQQTLSKIATTTEEAMEQDLWLGAALIPYLRKHFNPKVDQVLARAAETLSADLGLLREQQQQQQQQLQLCAELSSLEDRQQQMRSQLSIAQQQQQQQQQQQPHIVLYPLQPSPVSHTSTDLTPHITPTASPKSLRTSRKADRTAQHGLPPVSSQRSQHSMAAVQLSADPQLSPTQSTFTILSSDTLTVMPSPVAPNTALARGLTEPALHRSSSSSLALASVGSQQGMCLESFLGQDASSGFSRLQQSTAEKIAANVSMPPQPSKQQPTTEEKVTAAISQRKLLQPGERVLVAVSGGKDSLCLMHLLHNQAPAQNWHLVVGHCNHQWRADAGANADHVRSIAGELGLQYCQSTAPDPDLIRSEARARQWRYSELARMATSHGCTSVVTGHTASDRAETLLLNLLRGAGMTGMQALGWSRPLAIAKPWVQLEPETLRHIPAANTPAEVAARTALTQIGVVLCVSMPSDEFHDSKACEKVVQVNREGGTGVPVFKLGSKERPVGAELRLVRPLLCLSHIDTASYCVRQGLSVWEDTTNADVHTARRNRVRIQLLPKLRARFGPEVELILSDRAEALAQDLSLLEHQASQLLQTAKAAAETTSTATSGDDGSAEERGSPLFALSRTVLRAAPLALQRRAIKQWLEQLPGMRGRVNFTKVEAVLQLLSAPNHAMTQTLAVLAAPSQLNESSVHSSQQPVTEQHTHSSALSGSSASQTSRAERRRLRKEAAARGHKSLPVAAYVRGDGVILMWM